MDYIATRRALHQIPELGFEEVKTQRMLLDIIEGFDQQRLTIETWRTGIFVFVEGENPSKTIGYRTDIDGLPLVEKTGYPFASLHEGKMHACGHDFHMTIALGALENMTKQPPQQNVLFLFQPAEEGPGGAQPMLEAEAMKKWRPDEIFALHVAPELPERTLSVKSGLLFANTSELFIDFKGKGGHAAYPHKTKDMTVAASYFVTQLQEIVARRVDPLESAVVTIGKIEAGTVQNIIAETARLEGTIRTTSGVVMSEVKEELEKISRGMEIANDCKVEIDYGSNYYQVYNDEAVTSAFTKLMEELGYECRVADRAMTGEDFGYMLKEIPGFMFWLGVNSESGLHQSTLDPKEEALEYGVSVVTDTLYHL
ncbi:N-acetyldiaminopimelate deacetylase [Salimicrobium sp. PL1-032A]|uniref:N-acetyldiaminopimelate deacetylase n=1 Tax=Salimicrobium sp. PL1-032A TaxID=3095364 RepID=UPI00326131C9